MKIVNNWKQLDALPVRAVVLGKDGNAWQMRSKRRDTYAEWAVAMRAGGLSTSIQVAEWAPLVVLYEPTQTAPLED